MTRLYLEDAYLREAPAVVEELTEEGGIVVDAPLFYPTGGGQPGDCGTLTWAGGAIEVATAIKGADETVILVPAEPAALPEEGTAVMQQIAWPRRHRLMRMHTALHLLSVVLPLPVTGGQVGEQKSRLDFAMPEPPEDKAALEAALNDLVARDLWVSTQWVSEVELDAAPELVKTMSVAPPRGAGRVRLVRIGTQDMQVDLQPCGGTHVARTGEIGRVEIGKIENKGKANRRVHLILAV